MKFLCVPCDRPMTLEEKTAPKEGSISLVYSCPDCGYEFAMVTNAYETQLVSSLGVRIGPDGEPAASESKCPFTGMAQELTGVAPAVEQGAGSSAGMPWTPEARERMADVPPFVKPMVESGIERFAREKGYPRIDEKVLDEARGFFGMG